MRLLLQTTTAVESDPSSLPLLGMTVGKMRPIRFLTLAAIGALTLLLLFPATAHSQAATGTATVVVPVTADSLPVPGATIAASGSATNGATDRSGLATFTLPRCRRSLRVTSTGFRPESLAVN